MTVRRKLLLLVYVPVIVSTISAVVISSYKIRKQGIENLEDKSEAILDLSIQEYCLNHIDASSIIEQEEEAQMGKKLHNYNFRISSLDPENSKHNASSKDIEFIDHFEKEKNNQISYIDSENDSLWVMRPVFMDKTKGCLECHAVTKSGKHASENDLRGIFIITSSMDQTGKEVRSAITQISLLGILITAMAIMIGRLIVLKILNVTQQIVSVSKKVSEGDLNQKVLVKSSDEFGELASYINSMITALNEVLTTVRDAATDLATSTRDIASTSEEISQGAKNQSSQFEKLNISFHTSSGNALKASDYIGKSVTNARAAESGMSQTIKSMEVIEKSSAKINEAVKIINSISFQTNILALNAAVEAAHAGIHGKGFSVIASEVKKLSEVTTNSSAEINIITTENLSQVVSGVNIASDAGVLIAEILKSISLIAQMLKDITKEAQEQAKIIESNLEITNLNTLAAEKLSASASSLDNQANQLLDIVKHFNLS